MAEPDSNIARLAAMLQGLNLPPGALAQIARDPVALRELLSKANQRNRARSRGAKTQDSSDEGPGVDEIMLSLRNAKAAHLRERLLPPTKAVEPPRMELLQQFSRSARERSIGGIDTGSGSYVRQTYIGVDPDHSTKRLEDLDRIRVSQMLARKRHEVRGTVGDLVNLANLQLLRMPTFYAGLLANQVCAAAILPHSDCYHRFDISQVRLVAVNVVVEDPEGGTTKLAMYHYPFSLGADIEELDEIFSVGAFLAIREPYYKFGGDAPMVRVDAPSDIVFLEPDSPLVRSVRWVMGPTIAGVPRFPATPAGWKDRGVSHFKHRRWLCAAVAFSEGLKLDPKNHLLLLNRAEAYLRLNWNISAAHDAEMVIGMNLGDASLRLKAVYRAAKARYCLGHYEEVLLLAKSIPDDTDLKSLSERASARLRESTTGEYDWLSVFKECQKKAPRPDIASYTQQQK